MFTRAGGNASFSMKEILAAKSPKWAALTKLETPPAPSSFSHLGALSKRPRDSFCRVHLPLSTSQQLRHTMLNARGYLRLGRLLEELDSFAGVLAQLHCDDGDASAAPPLLVTAAFDGIDVLTQAPIAVDKDLVLEGCVSFAGSSSLNIAIDVLPLSGGGTGRPLLQAHTTFVARDAGGKAVVVPRLVPETPEESALWEAGRRASEMRKRRSTASLLRVPPTEQELGAVHSSFLASLGGGGGGSWAWASPRTVGVGRVSTEATRLSSTHVTHPQDKNVYGRVFGGHLMRLAYETAWACGWKATAHAPRFLGISDVLFRRPVEVGELLTVTAEVGYCEGSAFTVLVDVEQERPRVAAPQVSNQLSFLFCSEEDGHPCPTFFPESYNSTMKWIAGSRQVAEWKARAAGAASVEPRFPRSW
jgi:acyl-coenzyme A thioesterase 9